MDNDKFVKSVASSILLAASITAAYSGNVLETASFVSLIVLLWRKNFSQVLFRNSDNFNERVVNLAGLLTQLPEPNLSNYKRLRGDDLLLYLSEKITGAGFLAAYDSLQLVDPNIVLVIKNKECIFEPDEFEGAVYVPVQIADRAWFGFPTENTRIVSVNDGLSSFQLL